MCADVNPFFVAQMEPVLAYMRRYYKRAKLRFKEKDESLISIEVGRLYDTCDKWGWRFFSDHEFHTPLGKLDIERESKSTVYDHARHSWHLWHMSTDNRTRTMEAPLANKLYPVLQAHKKRKGSENECWLHRSIAVGSTPDWRSTRSPDLPCPCGSAVREATRRHWTWNCPLTEETGDQPMDTCDNNTEEALALRCIKLPQPAEDRVSTIPHLLTTAMSRAKDTNGTLLIATDGGSTGDVACADARRCGGVGVAVASEGQLAYNHGAVLTGADQTPWAAEVSALSVAVGAACKASKHAAHIMIDNRAVCDSFRSLIAHVKGEGNFFVPRFARGRWHDIWEELVRSNCACGFLRLAGMRTGNRNPRYAWLSLLGG